jgi:hypothetical protein
MEKEIDYKPYMDSDYKVYVDVTENRRKDGQVTPLSFVWEDGAEYEIDRVTDVRPAASLKAGGAGLRYTVKVRNQETYMFFEENKDGGKWFMERRIR